MVLLPLLLNLALAADREALHASCVAAMAAEDEVALLTCVETWIQEAPDAGYTDYYGFYLAQMRGDARAASAARTRAASKGGIPEEKLRRVMAADLPENPLVLWSQRALGVVSLLIILAVIGLRLRSLGLAAQGRYQG